MNGTTETDPGHVGNLVADQELKLQQLWTILIQSWDSNLTNPKLTRTASVSSPGGERKSHRKFLSFGWSSAEPAETDTSGIPENLVSALRALDTKSNETKDIQTLLSKISGDQLRSAYLTALKQDHPDALLLRFLRAENWNVPKAYIKFVSCLHWRVKEYKVDDEILPKGEEYALEQSQNSSDSTAKEDSGSFLLQHRIGKGHFHGCDKLGRPICIVPVRNHDPKAQTDKGLNDFIVHCIETVRLLQVPPVETMTLIFDMTSFTLGNWDFPPIQFVVKSFQENYPESLGAFIFYNPPWIFSRLWKLIHAILDPVVASKVHFLHGVDELEKIIPRDRVPKELGGDEDWEYEYIEPQPHENDKLHDNATKNELLTERNELGNELFQNTKTLISDPNADSAKSRRNEVIEKLRINYWNLDPYVRSRTQMDRTGVIQEGGKIEFYPAEDSRREINGESKMKIEQLEHAHVALASVPA